ncbi:polysaccharide pyruvyl transferase family protein [Amylibacter sp.]|nr:polysaccharide pyruvyl transferase family protein [Amylibacter sp.]
MNEAIKLFFYRSSTGKLNFGDELSPEIVSFVSGRRVRRVSRNQCDLIAIGSILDKQCSLQNKFQNKIRLIISRPVFVWGSGLISDKQKRKPAFIPLALRGKLTKNNLSLGPELDIPLGDPALFVSQMICHKLKRCGIGIVPHYTDKGHPLISYFNNIPNVKIIDVERGGSEVCREIASCDFILSSSLHGLVIADAFNIPNYQIRLFDKLKGRNFKFRDYHTALNRKDTNEFDIFRYKDITDLKKIETDFSYQDKIDDICTRLEKVLKFYF